LFEVRGEPAYVLTESVPEKALRFALFTVTNTGVQKPSLYVDWKPKTTCKVGGDESPPTLYAKVSWAGNRNRQHSRNSTLEGQRQAPVPPGPPPWPWESPRALLNCIISSCSASIDQVTSFAKMITYEYAGNVTWQALLCQPLPAVDQYPIAGRRASRRNL